MVSMASYKQPYFFQHQISRQQSTGKYRLVFRLWQHGPKPITFLQKKNVTGRRTWVCSFGISVYRISAAVNTYKASVSLNIFCISVDLYGYFLTHFSLISTESSINEGYVPRSAFISFLLYVSRWAQYQPQYSDSVSREFKGSLYLPVEHLLFLLLQAFPEHWLWTGKKC